MPLNEEARTRIREAWANWTPTPGVIGAWAVFKNGVVFHCGRTAVFPRRGQATRAKNVFLERYRLLGISPYNALNRSTPEIYYPSVTAGNLVTDRYQSLNSIPFIAGSKRSNNYLMFYDEELQAQIADMFVVRQITAEDLGIETQEDE